MSMTKKRLNIITIKGIKDIFRNEGTILPPPLGNHLTKHTYPWPLVSHYVKLLDVVLFNYLTKGFVILNYEGLANNNTFKTVLLINKNGNRELESAFYRLENIVTSLYAQLLLKGCEGHFNKLISSQFSNRYMKRDR